MFLVFDTETTGLPRSFSASITDLDNWPRVVQLAWQLYDANGNLSQDENFIILPDGFTIPEAAAKIHGITTERAICEGVPLERALLGFAGALKSARVLVAHNIEFDTPIVQAEFLRLRLPPAFGAQTRVCTMKSSTKFCGKWPKLAQLHSKLFGCDFEGAHDAKVDVAICAKCFFELRKRGIIDTRS